MRLRTYFFRDLDATAGLADGYLEDTRRYLERYGDEIGAYPYTEFSVVASPLPTGFGMPTLTYLGADVLRLPFIRATSLGHEVLHNWWGNGVYVDYAQGNWSEGLTTFMADYAYKERESAEAAREMRQGWLRDFAAVPAGSHRSSGFVPFAHARRRGRRRIRQVGDAVRHAARRASARTPFGAASAGSGRASDSGRRHGTTCAPHSSKRRADRCRRSSTSGSTGPAGRR